MNIIVLNCFLYNGLSVFYILKLKFFVKQDSLNENDKVVRLIDAHMNASIIFWMHQITIYKYDFVIWHVTHTLSTLVFSVFLQLFLCIGTRHINQSDDICVKVPYDAHIDEFIRTNF